MATTQPSPSAVTEFRDRHLAFYLDLARASGSSKKPVFIQDPDREMVSLLRSEIDNLRAALAWTLETGRIEDGLELVGALDDLWLTVDVAEGMRWCERLLESPGGSPRLRARANVAAGRMLSAADAVDPALRRLDEARRLFESAGDGYGAAQTVQLVAWTTFMMLGNASEVLPLFERALAVFRAHDATAAVADTLRGMGWCHRSLGDHAAAARLHEEGLAVLEELGDVRLLAEHLGIYSNLMSVRNPPEEYRLNNLALEKAREAGDRRIEGWCLVRRGRHRLQQWQVDEAADVFSELLEVGRTLDDPDFVARALTGQARVAVRRGEVASARELLEQASKEMRRAGPSDLARHARWELLALRHRFARLEGDVEGAKRLLEEAVAVVAGSPQWDMRFLGLSILAELERDLGNAARAEALRREAAAARSGLEDLSAAARALMEATIEADEGRTSEALDMLRRASASGDGTPVDLANLRWKVGEVLFEQGDYRAARAEYEATLASDEPKVYTLESQLGPRIARAFLVEGDPDGADRRLADLGWKWRVELDPRPRSELLETLAMRAIARKDATLGAELLGAAASLRSSAVAPPRGADAAFIEGRHAAAREALGDGAFEAAFAAGSSRHAELLERVLG